MHLRAVMLQKQIYSSNLYAAKNISMKASMI